MFDDQQNSAGSVPGNLPIGEPEDIFATTDAGAPVSDTPLGSPMPAMPTPAYTPRVRTTPEPAGAPLPLEAEAPYAPASGPARVSAMDAGILRPKVSDNQLSDLPDPMSAEYGRPNTAPAPTAYPASMQSASGAYPAPADMYQPSTLPTPDNTHLGAGTTDMYKIKGPSSSRGLLVLVVVLVALLIVSAGGWWIYSSFIVSDEDKNGFDSPAVVVEETEVEEADTNNNIDVGQEATDSALLFGPPVDKDEDLLDDDIEKNLGTDPNNFDSDGDKLKDGEEVLVWSTDPLNPDTDGDNYPDGVEVENGYNPLGEGKLLNVPTSTPTSS